MKNTAVSELTVSLRHGGMIDRKYADKNAVSYSVKVGWSVILRSSFTVLFTKSE